MSEFLDMGGASLEEADAAILSIPYEGTVCYGTGTAQGPAAILRAGPHLETFDEELSDFQADRLLDFFLKALGPSVYNQAVGDVRKFMLEKLEDLGWVPISVVPTEEKPHVLPQPQPQTPQNEPPPPPPFPPEAAGAPAHRRTLVAGERPSGSGFERHRAGAGADPLGPGTLRNREP